MDTGNEKALLDAALAGFKAPDATWEVLARKKVDPAANRRADTLIRLNMAGQQVDYVVEVKRNLRPQTIGPVLHQLATIGPNALLVADYVTPPLAERLRAQGIQFIDAAGNGYLRNPGLFVWIKGERPADLRADTAPTGRAFQRTGLQVLFTLLCKPEAVNLPYREIALLAGVAHGTVGWVMPELPLLGFVVELKQKRRLVNGEMLLRQWVEAYARKLRPKLALARYDAEALNWTAEVDAPKYKMLLGGEPAARRLTGNLRPGTATFYAEELTTKLMIDFKLRPDPRGNVEVLRKFWAFPAENPGLVPDVLVYADLIATGDARCLEVAKELHAGIANRLV